MVLHKWTRITDQEYEQIYKKARKKSVREMNPRIYPNWYNPRLKRITGIIEE